MTIFDKCKAVIESCETPEQMQGALKYIGLAFTGYLINVEQWSTLNSIWDKRRKGMNQFPGRILPKRTDEGW